MAKKLILKKGNKADLPSHADLGEPLFCQDTGELYVGMGDNLPLKPIRDAEANSRILMGKVLVPNMSLTSWQIKDVILKIDGLDYFNKKYVVTMSPNRDLEEDIASYVAFIGHENSIKLRILNGANPTTTIERYWQYKIEQID